MQTTLALKRKSEDVYFVHVFFRSNEREARKQLHEAGECVHAITIDCEGTDACRSMKNTIKNRFRLYEKYLKCLPGSIDKFVVPRERYDLVRSWIEKEYKFDVDVLFPPTL